MGHVEEMVPPAETRIELSAGPEERRLGDRSEQAQGFVCEVHGQGVTAADAHEIGAHAL
jgi:hypothetical protein